MKKFYAVRYFLLVMVLGMVGGKGWGQTNHLVISQVYGGGGNTGATYQNDFVELFNPTGNSISLTGFSVQQAAPTGTSWSVITLTGSIAAGKYYLIKLAGSTANGSALPSADVTNTTPNIGVGGSKVLLANTTTAFTTSCPTSASIIDFVGFGNANCAEGSAASAHTNTTSTLRATAGCTDSDNNSTDFSSGTPNPRNSSSTANYCYATKLSLPTPATQTAGTGFSVTVTSQDAGGNTKAVTANTTITLTASGSSISGTTTGTISSGSSSVIISGVVLTASAAATITATASGGSTLTAVTTGSFVVNAAGSTAPTVTTNAATSITTTGATLNGTVNANGSNTTASFDYGLTTTYSSTNNTATTPVSGFVTGSSNTSTSVSITSLSVNTQYHFRANASGGAGGTTNGSDLTFYTLANTPSAPIVNGPTTSSLNVAIGSGDGNPATTTFAIQETNSGNYVQSNGSLGATAIFQTASIWGTKTVTGLAANTTYIFQVKARNGDAIETAFGTTTSGTTSALAASITPTPTALTSFNYTFGSGPSTAQSFTISANNLTSGGGTVTITGSTDYEVSTTSATSGFGATATLTYTGTGTLSSNTVWVRLKAGLAVGAYNSETVGISGGGASSSVTASGSVSAPAPANDLCANATTIALDGATINGTMVNATVSFSTTATGDVWYKVVPTCTGNLTVSSSNNGMDLNLYIFSSSCPSTSSGYADCGCTSTSTTSETVTSPVTAGATYYIRIGQFSGTANTFTFTATNSVTPRFTLANTGSPAAGNVGLGSTATLFGFALTPTACTNSFDFTAASVTTSGTVTTTDLSNFRLIVDANSDGVADVSEIASPVATVASLSNPLIFSPIAGQTGLTSATRYLLIADVSANAVATHTFTASLTSANVTASVSVTGSASGNTQTIPIPDFISLSNLGSPYTENFNGMSTSTTAPQGFTIQDGNTTTVTSSLSAEASSGSPTTGGSYNWGQTTSERALGFLYSGSYSGKSVLLKVKNSTGSTINTFTLSFDYEQYRRNSATQTFKLQYSTSLTSGWVDISGGNFSNLSTGASTYGFATLIASQSISISGYIPAAPVSAGATVYFRWILDGSSSSNGVGVDNLSISACRTLSASILSNNSPICSGNDATFNLTGTSGAVVSYKINSGSTQTVTLTGGSASVTITGATTNQTIALVSVDEGNCSTSLSGTSTVTANPATTITSITPASQSECKNAASTNLVVSATGTGTLTYQWYSNSSNSNSGGTSLGTSNGAQTNTYTPPTDNAVTLYYYVVVSGSCGTATSSVVSVTVNALPTADVAGNGPICSGGNAVFTISATNGNTSVVTYNINGGTNTTVNLTGGTATVTVTGATTDQTLNLVSITNTVTGCVRALSGSATVTITVVPAPTVTITQPDCTSSNGVITVTAPTGSGETYSDGSTYQSGATFSGLAAGTYNVTAKTSAGCVSPGTVVLLSGTYTWNGTSSTSWTDAANWSCGSAPSATENAVITAASTFKPVLTANTTISGLTIQSGAKITIGTNIFTINGDVSGPGYLTGSSTSNLVVGGTGGSGTINFDPTTDSITNVLNNFTLSRANGNISIGNKLNLLSVLNVNNGGTLNPNGNVVLRSTSIAATARVAPVTGSIVGDVTVERFIPATKRAYRFISPSVTTSTSIKANWMEGQNNPSTSVNLNSHKGYGTHITGYAGDGGGFDVTQNNAPSLFIFNNGPQGWTNVPSTNVNLTAGFPYRLFVRGDRSISLSTNTPTPTPTILRTTGVLKTGSVLYSKTSSPLIYPVIDSFSYMGNPYASPVDWNALSKNNLSTTYYTWDPHLSRRGAYAYYNTTDDVHNPSNSSVNQYIQPGQAFFVQAKGTNPTLQFTESSKASTFTQVFRGASSVPTLSIQLLFYDLIDGTRITGDGVAARFDDSYSPNIADEDSRKFYNLDENMAIVHGDTTLSIEGRPFVRPTDTMHLRVWQYRQNDYFLKLDASSFVPGTSALVEDAFLNLETTINIDDSTLIPFSITTDPASFAPDRFIVVFKPGSVLPVTVTDVKAYQKDKGIQVDWISRSETNIVRYEIEKSLNGQRFEKAGSVEAKGNNAPVISYGWFDATPADGANYYRLKIVDKSGVITYSQIVKVTIGKAASSIAVYPNPVKGNTISLHLTNMQKGKYTVNLYNNLGQKMVSKEITHDGSSANYSIPAGRLLSKGTYRLNVSNGDVEMNTTVIFE